MLRKNLANNLLFKFLNKAAGRKDPDLPLKMFKLNFAKSQNRFFGL